MLIFRYIFKETLKSQLAIFFILMVIFIMLKFVRILGDATDGDLPTDLVVGFIALYSPVLASLILPISLFLGVMLAHGRLYADSEMAVLKACGVSEWYVTRVTLILAVVLALFTGFITLYLVPTAIELEQKLESEASKKSGIAAVLPGRFQETGDGNAIIFVHNIKDESNQLDRIFLARPSEDGEEIHLIYSNSGAIESASTGNQELILKNGRQYEGTKSQNNFQVVNFDEYSLTLEQATDKQTRQKVAAIPTLELMTIDTIEAKAEFQWRLAIPLSLPFLVLIAVPLSAVDPRQGRFGKILPALLLYLGYYLLLLASRRVMEDGAIPSFIGLWWVHSIMLVIGTLLHAKERKSGAFVRRQLLSN